ncbi:Sulfotransferase family protein [Desulfacinum infernum DSM 9756]|uniref:Sulfotransferase family protein n=1 Tax=Desulfacinum infernum DSM 9756 TaxID=1121391 RepID=A0A1M4WWZ2_9BACT|nr:sulfotransferase family 2 domain-containing protein [Desulfacinum infernum]SHE85725.1 Sulfotransferase family protein [Desulfacinum infernum DSM 9756]
MIISHTHKFIFIKSLKTAGTSVEAALSQHCQDPDVVTPLGDYKFNRDEQGRWIHKSMNAEGFWQHDHAVSIRKKVGDSVWKEYFKFTIVRNPWDRVVSLYFWHSRNKPEFKPQRKIYHKLGWPFNELREIRKVFDKFVEGEWETNDKFYLIDGDLCVDFAVRYENLSDDLNKVCQIIGLPPLELPSLKKGFRPDKHHYSEYYTEKSKKIVADRHANDIKFFGYVFDES